jgi:hypothetical protein
MAFVMVGKIGKSWKMGQTDSVHIAMLASVSCDICTRGRLYVYTCGCGLAPVVIHDLPFFAPD